MLCDCAFVNTTVRTVSWVLVCPVKGSTASKNSAPKWNNFPSWLTPRLSSFTKQKLEFLVIFNKWNNHYQMIQFWKFIFRINPLIWPMHLVDWQCITKRMEIFKIYWILFWEKICSLVTFLFLNTKKQHGIIFFFQEEEETLDMALWVNWGRRLIKYLRRLHTAEHKRWICCSFA